jgi:hypothetical protein
LLSQERAGISVFAFPVNFARTHQNASVAVKNLPQLTQLRLATANCGTLPQFLPQLAQLRHATAIFVRIDRSCGTLPLILR